MSLLACGNCFWSALYLAFPAIESLRVILPIWLAALAVLRIILGRSIRGVPRFDLFVLLLLATLVVSPMSGPVPAAWIPICAVIGTVTLLRDRADRRGRRPALLLLALAVLAGVGFGMRDYARFDRLSPEERDMMRPPWHRPARRLNPVEPPDDVDRLSSRNGVNRM